MTATDFLDAPTEPNKRKAEDFLDETPSDFQHVNDPSKGPEWNATQQELAASAQSAGLPPANTGWDRLVGAVQRAQASGYIFPHFAGTEFDPTGDRSVTMDMENLSKTLLKKETDERSAGKVDQANATARERAYWESQAVQGMTARQWKDQTGNADPELPPNGSIPSTRGANEINQADAQQYLERQAGQLSQFSDVGQVASDAMKLPGKIGLMGGNIMAGGPQVAPHWPTDQEVQTPVISPELARAMITAPFGPGVSSDKFAKTGVQGAIRGTLEGAGDALSSFSTPESLGLLGIAPEGKLAQRAIAGMFLGQAISGTPEQWKAFNAADNLADKIRIATSMGLGYALPIAGGVHSFKGEAPARAGEVPKAESSRLGTTDTAPPEAVPRVDTSLEPQHIPGEVGGQENITGTTGANVRNDMQGQPQPDITKGGTEVNAPADVSAAPNPEPQGVPRAVPGQAEVPKVAPSGASAEDWELKPGFKEKYPSVALKVGDKIISGKPPNVYNHADLAEKNGFPNNAIPGFLDEHGDFVYQYAEDAPSVLEPSLAHQQEAFPPKANPETQGVSDTTGQMESTPTSTTTGIANRVLDEEAKAGRIDPIQAGEGMSWQEMVDLGRQQINAGADPQMIARRFQRNGRISAEDFAVLRAERERLAVETNRAQDILRTAPADPNAIAAYNQARKTEVEWIQKVVQPAKTATSDIFRGMQGEAPIDATTFAGLRRAALDIHGKDVTPSQAATLMQVAAKAERAARESMTALQKASQRVEQQFSRNRKTPPRDLETLRNDLAQRLREATPC